MSNVGPQKPFWPLSERREQGYFSLGSAMNARSLALRHLTLSRPLPREPALDQSDASTMRPLVWTSPTITYVICTNPRSGSWLLSEGLASTGLAGNPREWFNIHQEQQHRARWRMEHSTDLTFAMYLGQARAESTTANGISGIKLHYNQLLELAKRMAMFERFRGLTAPQLMSKVIPNANYLWLIRRDKLRQAISFQIAASTSEWWKTEDAATSRHEGRACHAKFDAHAIARIQAALTENDFRWQACFQENEITPFVVYYEDLAADYLGVIRSVLKWLRIPNAEAVAVPPSRLKRQANWRNEKWVARYLKFKSDSGHLSQDPALETKTDPLFERAQKPFERIPNSWKQWVAQSKFRGTSDDAIVEVLTHNGYSQASARAEVERAAAADPTGLEPPRTDLSVCKT